MRRCLSLLRVVVLLLIASPLSAAVVFDAASNGDSGGSGDVTFSHTIGAGSDMVLFVGISEISSQSTSDVTYNSLSMTLVASIANNQGGWGRLYRYLGPASGAHNVVVVGPGSHATASSVSYSGVGSVPTSATQAAAGAATITTTLTVASANAYTLVFIHQYGSDPIAGSGAAGPISGSVSTFFSSTSMFDSGGALSTGSYSMTVTSPGTIFGMWGVMAELAPPGGGGGATSHPCSSLRLLGVGCVQ